MTNYQEEYINNCRRFKELTRLPIRDGNNEEEIFNLAMGNMDVAKELSRRNTSLIVNHIVPVFDEIYQQDKETLTEIEAFGDALSSGAEPLDLALSEQIFSALLSVARRFGSKKTLIRILYKLGMIRYKLWNMLTGVDVPETDIFSLRMRSCFEEAAGYLEPFSRFDTFDDETKAYVFRSVANIYLGSFSDWRDKLSCVRKTMRIFTDSRYRASAPDLPWDSYMDTVHRQMVSVLPHNYPDGTVSPDAVVDVMESAHLIYELQYEAAAKTGKPLQAQRYLPYYTIEFDCGIISKEELLIQMRRLMDEADPTVYDNDNMYRIISMTAFYAQYITFSPELIPKRQRFIISSYDRIMSYVHDMPLSAVNGTTHLYMRQLLAVYLELDGGPTFRDLALKMMMKFSPTTYAHGYAVGKMAQFIGEEMLKRDGGYFAGLDNVSDALMDAGLLHDLGKMSFIALHNHAGRQSLAIEDVALRLHSTVGWQWLRRCESTKICAEAALGHHKWYNGVGGYPDEFSRAGCAHPKLVDVIALADYLDGDGCDNMGLLGRTTNFESDLEIARARGGTQFAPELAELLRDDAIAAELRRLYDCGRRDGFYRCFKELA